MKRIVKKPTVRKREIIKAAAQLFLTKDYEKTTLQDVMEYLNLAKGTIYHYFASKDDLLEAVVMDMVEARIYETEKRLKETGGNALQKVEKLVDLVTWLKIIQSFLRAFIAPQMPVCISGF